MQFYKVYNESPRSSPLQRATRTQLSLRAKMSTARRYRPHYLVADYQQWEGHWELWFGTAVAMAPAPFGPHERAVSEISFQIQSSVKSR